MRPQRAIQLDCYPRTTYKGFPVGGATGAVEQCLLRGTPCETLRREWRLSRPPVSHIISADSGEVLERMAALHSTTERAAGLHTLLLSDTPEPATVDDATFGAGSFGRAPAAWP